MEMKETKKATNLTKNLGYRTAAGYLRNRGFGFTLAYFCIFGKMPRR